MPSSDQNPIDNCPTVSKKYEEGFFLNFLNRHFVLIDYLCRHNGTTVEVVLLSLLQRLYVPAKSLPAVEKQIKKFHTHALALYAKVPQIKIEEITLFTAVLFNSYHAEHFLQKGRHFGPVTNAEWFCLNQLFWAKRTKVQAYFTINNDRVEFHEENLYELLMAQCLEWEFFMTPKNAVPVKGLLDFFYEYHEKGKEKAPVMILKINDYYRIFKKGDSSGFR